MAKDGTLRGGTRARAGRKVEYDPEKRIENGDFPDPEALTGAEMPPVKKYLSAKQHKDMQRLTAKEIFVKTWEWLVSQKCEKAVNPQLIEQYAMSTARWIQAERAISEFGFLGKHPTTGEAIASPYVSIASGYARQANAYWAQIQQIVRERGSGDAGGEGFDPMEQLMKEQGL